MTERRDGQSERDQQKPPGVIDTIGAAFSLLNRRPYLIWIPLALDVILWLVPSVPSGALAARIATALESAGGADAATLDLIRQAGNQTDVLIWLAAFTPSFLASVGSSSVAASPIGAAEPVGLAWWAVPLVAALLAVIGVVIGMAYLTIVRALIVGEPIAPRAFMARTSRNALRMLGFLGVVLGLTVMLLIPVGLFTAVLLGVGLNVVPIVGLVLTVAVVWALVLLYFADEAIVLSEAGPLRSIALSATVIRRDFGPAMRLIIVLTLISMGAPIALQFFAQSPWSVPFAFVVHAYLATGTATAAMLFYGDRIARIAATAEPDMPASSREAN